MHKMAKQVLLDARHVMLPAWERTAWLNDLDGQPHFEPVTRAARIWNYARARQEEWMVGARPDVVLEVDDARTPPLLVEIRVTHAVDQTKAALVHKRGWAMIEIDLSKLDSDTVLEEAFANVVLHEAANRAWIHSPAAEKAFGRAERALEQRVADLNRKILKARRELEERRRRNQAQLDGQRRSRERYRTKLRAPHLKDLEALSAFADPHAARLALQAQFDRDSKAIELASRRYLNDEHLPPFLSHIRKGWQLVGAHPWLWQLSLWGEFVHDMPVGTLIDTKRWVPWLGNRFGYKSALKRLFDAQQRDSQGAREKGFRRWGQYRAWFFEDWENELIPSPFELVGALADQLWRAGLVEPTDTFKVYEVVSTEADLSMFEKAGPMGPTPSLPTPPTRESEEERRVRKRAELISIFEEHGEPYTLCPGSPRVS
ncbi:hypothetical protein ACFONC_09105 [Luteimonas soli]|uniref:DUF2357 domain-containing protein n=1 Tax=Luteimonas soli TaxID=1648966 RepID=A0ABV7XJG8_9GAMM